MNNYKFGWIKPKSRPNDVKLYSVHFDKVSNLPSSVDLRPKDAPIYDQTTIGSCVANAVAGAIQFIQPSLTPSRLFQYYNARLIEGTTDQDAGSSVHDGIQSVVKYGTLPESEYPYNVDIFDQKPPDQDYTDALKDIITDYFALDTEDEIKQCLASGYPVIFGADVFDEIQSEEVAETGILPMPKKHEQPVGGHGLELVGYDDNTQMYITRNSWSASWGQSGYFMMPYKYFAKYSSDCWTIRADKQTQSAGEQDG